VSKTGQCGAVGVGVEVLLYWWVSYVFRLVSLVSVLGACWVMENLQYDCLLAIGIGACQWHGRSVSGSDRLGGGESGCCLDPNEHQLLTCHFVCLVACRLPSEYVARLGGA
jgi:hypothetical protein